MKKVNNSIKGGAYLLAVLFLLLNSCKRIELSTTNESGIKRDFFIVYKQVDPKTAALIEELKEENLKSDF